MLGGESTSVGIVFYDTGKSGDNAVFCRFEEEKPVVESGERSNLLEKMKKLDKEREQKISFLRYVGWEILFFGALIAAVRIFVGGFFPVAGAFLFALGAWFPCLVLVFACKRTYADERDFDSFRKFHGAEHMMVSYAVRSGGKFDFEKAKTFSRIHRECGTVYASSAVILSAVLGASFGLIPKIGFWWFLAILFGAAVLLFLNLLNPYNPLTVFQRKVTAVPDEKPLLLAFEGIKKLFSEENEQKTEL